MRCGKEPGVSVGSELRAQGPAGDSRVHAVLSGARGPALTGPPPARHPALLWTFCGFRDGESSGNMSAVRTGAGGLQH